MPLIPLLKLLTLSDQKDMKIDHSNIYISRPLEWVPSSAFGFGGRGGGGAHIWLATIRLARLYPGDDVITPAYGSLRKNATRNLKSMSSSL